MNLGRRSKPQIPVTDSDDGDADALRRLYTDGVDLNKPHSVNFFVVIPDKENGEKVKEIIEQHGFECSLEENKEFQEWTCNCKKEMILEYNELIQVQNLLDKLCRPYQGFSDGWGTNGD